MTHELIASMLGVRREGVTDAAGKPTQGSFVRRSCCRASAPTGFAM